MSHETSTSTKTHVRTRWPALLLALGLGVGLGYLGRPAPTVSAPPSDGGERTVAPSGSPVASAVAPATAPRPAAPPRAEIAAPSAPATPTAPLPGPGPIAPLLPALRERAQRGDIAAARRAHRDLFFCEHARYARGSEPRDQRVRCVAEQLCGGLQGADFTEGGSFLLRAAELGDVEAMAAVALGFALGVNFSGPNLAASRTLGPQYLRRALEAAVPLALINAY